MTEVKIVVAGVEVTTTRHVGWKEIMEYVEIGRRAIRRLEEEEDFPIHRIPARHGKGKVFVYAAEVEKWMQKTGRQKRGTQKPAYDCGKCCHDTRLICDRAVLQRYVNYQYCTATT